MKLFPSSSLVFDDHINFFKSLLILSSLFARPLASRENKCAKELMFLVDELFILNGTYFFFVSRLWRKKMKN